MRRLTIIALCAFLLLGVAPPAGAQEVVVTVADLLESPEEYSAPQVPEIVIHGELVGDFGKRSDGVVWAQLNGDAYATAPLLSGGELAGPNLGIGVRIPAELWPELEEVAQAGGYRLRGPLVRLTGAWRYHDPDRGGESYLYVTGVEVYDEPVLLVDEADWVPFLFGIFLLCGAVLVAVSNWRRQRER